MITKEHLDTKKLDDLLLKWCRLWERIEEYVQNDDEAWEIGSALEQASIKASKTVNVDSETLFRRVVNEYNSVVHPSSAVLIWQDMFSDCIYLKFDTDSPLSMGYSWDVALNTLEKLVSDHVFDLIKRGEI